MIGADSTIGSDATIGNDSTIGADSTTIGADTIGAETMGVETKGADAMGVETVLSQPQDPSSRERRFNSRQAFAVSNVIIKTMANTTVVLTA